MSGFETAIRNALVRSSSGSPDARQRVYAAARASLERNLTRVNADEATATTQRQRLETTIDTIEGEWTGRPSAPPMPRAPEPPFVSEAKAPPTEPPTARTSPVEPNPAQPRRRPSPTEALDVDRSAATTSSDTASQAATPADAADLPEFKRASASRFGTNEARLMEPPPDDVEAPRRRDPFFTRGRSDPAETSAQESSLPVPPAPPTLPEQSGGVVPTIDPGTPRRTAPVSREPKLEVSEEPHGLSSEDGQSVEPSVESGIAQADPSESAAVEVKAPTVDRERRSSKRRSARNKRADRKQQRAARRKRWPFRIVAVVLTVGAIALAYWWIEGAGLLEANADRPAAITVARDANVETSGTSDATWTEVLSAPETSGAITSDEQSGTSALRVEGPGTVILSPGDLAPLGRNVRLAVSMRTATGDGAVAVSCAGGLICGRQRYSAPRETGELIFDAELGEGTLELVLDPTIDGSDSTIVLSGVAATGL